MTNEQRERLAAAVRDGLRRTGLSQKELARKSGTSAGQLCNALNGVGSMSPTKWEMCLEALGLDYHQLMAEEETRPPVQQETVEAYGQTYRRIDIEEREAEELRTRLQTVQKELEEQQELNKKLKADLAAEMDKGTQMEKLYADLSTGCKMLCEERDALVAERDGLKGREMQLAGERDKLLEDCSMLQEQVTELRGDVTRLTDVAAHFEELYNVVDAQLKAEVEQRNKREQAEREQAAQFEEADSYYARQLEKLKLAWFDKEHPELA